MDESGYLANLGAAHMQAALEQEKEIEREAAESIANHPTRRREMEPPAAAVFILAILRLARRVARLLKPRKSAVPAAAGKRKEKSALSRALRVLLRPICADGVEPTLWSDSAATHKNT
jgi:hypothetical protein